MKRINVPDLNKTRGEIKKAADAGERPIVVVSQDEKYDRKLAEWGRFDVLLGVERGRHRDTLRQQDSGFNHVIGKIMTAKKIALGIDLEDLRGRKTKEKAILMGRIAQNIKIARKTGTALKVVGAKDARDAFEFLISLGASTKQASEAVN